METEIEELYRESHLSDDLIGLRSMVQSAKIVSLAAWENKTSVGCHFRGVS